MTVIIDNSLGNIKSVYNMLRYLNINVKISNKIQDIQEADKLILPGVGAFDTGMKQLDPFIDILNYKVIEQKTPILGICLGMQLFCRSSQEGDKSGLGWIDEEIVKFKCARVPHVGWNHIQSSNTLFENIENPKFYFIHTYNIPLGNNTIATSNYHVKFTSSIQKDNIYGVQFHPEKSHKYGMQLFKNFDKI